MVENSTRSRTPARVQGLPALDRALVMGVVNVTPDSFSDGGSWFDGAGAAKHGFELVEQGADIVDVGGESTRPGAGRVDEDEELRRVRPVIAELARTGALVSIDTMRASVAEAALDAGARMVNDVSGGLADERMADVMAQAQAPYVVMHWRGHSDQMQRQAAYDDVAGEVTTELRQRIDRLVGCGVDPEQIIVDPGVGFAKTPDHDWALLANLHRVQELGRPVLVGASRKKFLGRVLADAEGTPRPADERDDASLALATLAAAAGVWCVRSHTARPTADAVRVAAAWRRAQ